MVIISNRAQFKEKLALLMDECYSQELSACPEHPIFQPQKAVNLFLEAHDAVIRRLIAEIKYITNYEKLDKHLKQKYGGE